MSDNVGLQVQKIETLYGWQDSAGWCCFPIVVSNFFQLFVPLGKLVYPVFVVHSPARQSRKDKEYRACPDVVKRLCILRKLFGMAERIIVATDAGRDYPNQCYYLH
ncbi:hypothetical protein [Alistipes putredinis]|uniref:hypothetical protein n=1 Tax=Alistipes putredinis TaxID=28117 RepID=UPI00242AD12E|nr:hypothetical protein [Alistipes putredinis]MBS6651860.1 hypothetical protein [Alistipes putredinis]